ncbi:hypothetical protein GRS96_01005 [Rathayibacter sp. VKM Ac-2803]|uniref:SIR2 family protein n=1 Tax=Rathayibacter sp. VKM Ac-2803 TaxID=2609256 RepID=UPI001359B8A2|nr:SIR2 family protein [Rathayibacter sp. VKM Ac-2803]MWV47850.1 hypothetical protein [Rathayibacter sp. VKM Ac-2803]
MPVTDQLGREIERRLEGEVAFDLRDDQTFEEWLTLQLTPLPFLPSYVNAHRAASATRVISEIASVLDARSDAAAAAEIPAWLNALVQLWSAEGALVITFNYDLLVERAATHAQMTSRAGHVIHYGEELVFPAPPVTTAQYAGDTGLDHTSGSFQLLKMHGSLNWFGSGSTSGSADLLRSRDKRGFAGRTAMIADVDYSGLRQLDRYLIPPMTSKDGYYSSSLMTSIWREAGVAIAEASELFILGYSLPREDRVVGELVAGLSSDVTVQVVDLDPGSVERSSGIIGRLNLLQVPAAPLAAGANAISNFAETRYRDLSTRFIEALKSVPGESDKFPVFVYRNESGVSGRSSEKYGLTMDEEGDLRADNKMPPVYARSGETSALSVGRMREMSLNCSNLSLRFGDESNAMLVVGLEITGGEAIIICAPSPEAL